MFSDKENMLRGNDVLSATFSSSFSEKFRHTRRNRVRVFRHRCQWRSVTADEGLPGLVSGGAEKQGSSQFRQVPVA